MLFAAFPSRNAHVDNDSDDDVDENGVRVPKDPYDQRSLLTLSGLLNALDGLVAQTGRVIIATTNYIERLDPALLRPGRVDFKVRFRYATKSQMVRGFTTFYSRLAACPHGTHPLSAEQLEATAAQFVERVGEGRCSMSELQSHLLVHRLDAQAALDNWRELVEAIQHRESIEAEQKAKQERKRARKEKAARKRAGSDESGDEKKYQGAGASDAAPTSVEGAVATVDLS